MIDFFKVNSDKFQFLKPSDLFIGYVALNFLMKFINEQGKLLPRRITGTSAKYQSRVNKAVKRARHLAILPYVGDMLK
mgnify:CR=1 FL=1